MGSKIGRCSRAYTAKFAVISFHSFYFNNGNLTLVRHITFLVLLVWFNVIANYQTKKKVIHYVSFFIILHHSIAFCCWINIRGRATLGPKGALGSLSCNFFSLINILRHNLNKSKKNKTYPPPFKVLAPFYRLILHISPQIIGPKLEILTSSLINS